MLSSAANQFSSKANSVSKYPSPVSAKTTSSPAHIPSPHIFVTPSSLSVILPTYNQEEVIESIIMRTMLTLTKWLSDFEVIVVNDDSQDHTEKIVARIAKEDARIRLINHVVHKGYEAALVTGFEAITKETVFYMDSDGQYDIADLARFFPLIEDYDAVLGYRINNQDNPMRKFAAWVWKQLVKFVFSVHVRDMNCAFKLYHSEFFHTHKLETHGAMLNAEILYKFARAGYIYTEVGVQHLPGQRRRTTGVKGTHSPRLLKDLIVYARKWRKEEIALI